MESVQKWFNAGCNYADGVAVYGNLPQANKNLLRIFKLKQTASNLEKLKYELGKFKNTVSTLAISKPVAPNEIKVLPLPIETTAVEVEKKQGLLFSQLPVELRPELLKANELFRKNCFLKANLNDLPEFAENEAFKVQTEISDNFKQNKICWQKIDFYLEHRQLPPTAKGSFIDCTPAQLLRKQQNYYSNISNTTKRLAENRLLLPKATTVIERTRLVKLIAKQEKNLLAYNDDLVTVTRLIDGK